MCFFFSGWFFFLLFYFFYFFLSSLALNQSISQQLLQRQQPGNSKWLSISNLRSALPPFF